MQLESKIPAGPLTQKWTKYRGDQKLVNPSNKRKYTLICVGTGLAGSAASASLAELGYNVKTFCIQDSPRRAHSIAAQGGINAAKNYPNDGDSIWRLFYDTIKGGDFRAREGNVYRLAEVSADIIDQGVAQGIPFARDYGGLLANRSFGGAQVSRTFYARGQTGQQLLLGAYSSLSRQIATGKVKMYPRREMMDLVIVNGKARGIIVRNLITGEYESHAGDAVLLCTGGYGNVFYLSTNAESCNVGAAVKCWRKGALMANPCFTQIHPTCIPNSGDFQAKLTLMSESLRNDGRVWVPKKKGDTRRPNDIPESERWYYLEEKYPSFGNLVPRDVASRNAKYVCDAGHGVGPTGYAVYLDFSQAIQRDGKDVVQRKYGNLFDMYLNIVDDNPYETPMMIYPASHYAMGGLWVDYELQTTIPGLFALGECNFSDHGANRLGASALMQGLADGYFVIPYTIAPYLASIYGEAGSVTEDHPAFKETTKQVDALFKKLTSINGTRTPDSIHRELGKVMVDEVGMSRNEAGLKKAIDKIRELREEFWKNLRVPGSLNDYNKNVEKAHRVADYLEFAETLAIDALERAESCGCHLREESQSEEGEALRKDDKYCYVAAWEYKGFNQKPELHKEPLVFENVQLTQRSYK